MRHIMWCPRCKIYTLKETCPKCGGKTIWKVPPKFSPEDRWGKYRREIKRRIWYVELDKRDEGTQV